MNPPPGADSGPVDADEVRALDSRRDELQRMLRERRQTEADLAANVELLRTLPPSKRGVLSSFARGSIRGVGIGMALSLLGCVLRWLVIQ